MRETCMCWGFPGDGWEPLIKIRETDETVLVMYQPSRKGIRNLLVVQSNPDELVTVKIGGKLLALATRAIEQREVARGLADEIGDA